MAQELNELDYAANKYAQGKPGNVKYMFSAGDWEVFKAEMAKKYATKLRAEYSEGYSDGYDAAEEEMSYE